MDMMSDNSLARAWAYVPSLIQSESFPNFSLLQISENSSMMLEPTQCPFAHPSLPHLGIILTLVDSVVAMFALLGNGLVIVSVLKYPSLRSATNMFVVNLAVADLLVGICIPYYVLFYFDQNWICEQYPCLFRYFTVLCFTVASMVFNVGVAVDRYLAIVHALAYPRLIGRWRVPSVITIGWVYVVTITALPLFGVHEWDEKQKSNCHSHLTECDLFYMAKTEFVILLGAHVLLTLVITTGLYLRIFRVAWRQMHSVAILQPHLRLHYEARTARVMALVLGVSLLGLAPYLAAIILPYAYFHSKYPTTCPDHTWLVLKKLAVCLYLGKSSLNPFIYGWKNTEFRSAFCRLLRLPYKDVSNSRVVVFSITKLP